MIGGVGGGGIFKKEAQPLFLKRGGTPQSRVSVAREWFEKL